MHKSFLHITKKMVHQQLKNAQLKTCYTHIPGVHCFVFTGKDSYDKRSNQNRRKYNTNMVSVNILIMVSYFIC